MTETVWYKGTQMSAKQKQYVEYLEGKGADPFNGEETPVHKYIGYWRKKLDPLTDKMDETYNSLFKAIQQAVREKREEDNLTSWDMCKYLGISKYAYDNMMEKYVATPPTIKQLIRVATKLNLNLLLIASKDIVWDDDEEYEEALTINEDTHMFVIDSEEFMPDEAIEKAKKDFLACKVPCTIYLVPSYFLQDAIEDGTMGTSEMDWETAIVTKKPTDKTAIVETSIGEQFLIDYDDPEGNNFYREPVEGCVCGWYFFGFEE